MSDLVRNPKDRSRFAVTPKSLEKRKSKLKIPGLKDIKLFSCSTQLSLKFPMLIITEIEADIN